MNKLLVAVFTGMVSLAGFSAQAATLSKNVKNCKMITI